ncbi:diguanylate cyclase domain-containing protein [Parachitinimonas caeni]|uniref:Diguanylate cyclase n=1 Tax=Parachitinimonas caeni TaxID=3031301 RepID=A0ABT7DSL0_9NEIS|nr:diguanylate cyclase [Parachitinimonas caeni]MDK2123041.1 diguanylate cyclase [Parachitinimonas caeni]
MSVAVRPVVLIVDDEVDNILILRDFFKDDGYQIIFARDGQRAIEMAMSQRVDLVLLDVSLPMMDGFQVCERLKSLPDFAVVPVLFLTSRTDAPAEERGFRVGGVDYIHKPFTPRLVRARVQTHLTLKAQHDRLAALAHADALTGLPNRAVFDQRVEDALLRRASDELVAMLFVDLDDFRTLNSERGAAAGDAVLLAVAQRLQRSIDPSGTVARFGSDEFVILLPAVPTAAAARKYAEQVCQQLCEPLMLDGESLSLGASVGIALAPDHGETASTLRRHADLAMYRAKWAGKRRWLMYSSDMA